MQNTVSQCSTPILSAKRGLMVLLATGILLIMAVPAYAGSAGDKDTEQAASPSKDKAVVDLYGNGMLMLQAPPHHSKTTKIATAEALDYLVPVPAKARALTARKVGNTIIIEAAKPVDATLPPENTNLQAASHPVVTVPNSSATRLIRSKDVIVMNVASQE